MEKDLNYLMKNAREESFMMIQNFAFLFYNNGNSKVLRVVDLNNSKSVADFFYDTKIQKFSSISSSFTEGKRKYEMLYYIERNTARLYRGMQDA